MIKFAVCDDESDMTEYISKKLLEYYPDECEIKKYTNSKSLLEDSRLGAFDAYFLDIGMPTLDGFETAKQIRIKDSRAKIIFVTGKEELAYLGYIYEAFRFVRKSRLDQELREAAKSLCEFFAASEEYQNFRTWTGEILINIKYIKYFKADGHSLILYGLKEEITDETIQEEIINETMQNVEDRLKKRGFIRIHKSYLVNFRFFYSLESKTIKLLSGEELPISRNRISEVKKMINQRCQFSDKLWSDVK